MTTGTNRFPRDTHRLRARRSARPSRANLVTRIQIRTGGYLARHPALLRVLEGLGWNNPGGSMNP